MAGPGLLVNNDVTYPDDGSDPSVHLHQTDHDAIHGIVNHIDKDTLPAGNGQVWVSVGGVMVPRLLTAADAGAVTQGLYARTQPLPDGGSGSFRPLAIDPNQLGVNSTGRIWGLGSRFAQIGYTDDDGATFVAKSAPLEAGVTPQQIVFTASWMWIVTASATGPSTGNLWRIPLPTANGNPASAGNDLVTNVWGATITASSNGQSLPQATINISNGNYFPSSGTCSVVTANGPQVVTYTGKTTFTLTGCSGGTGAMTTGGNVSNAVKVFGLDTLVNGPGGAGGAGNVNATFRNSSFAVTAAEDHAYLCEYGAANSTATIGAWTDGVMAAGSNLLFSATGTASASMVGLTITVGGAGSAGDTLTAVVTSVVRQATSACLQLSSPALTAVLTATVTFPSATYGAGVVVGGPSVYHSANPGAAAGSVVWAKAVTFPGAKHAHAVKVINSLPWVSLGDYGQQFPDGGMWIATSLAATSWTKRSTEPATGTTKDVINFFPVTVSGQSVVVGESDNGLSDGPLLFADATGGKTRVLAATCALPSPYKQTMRGLALLSNGNLMWFGTGETTAVGTTSCIWLSKTPYTTPVLLEDVGSAMDTESVGDPVVHGGYVWFGTQRCTQEKFLGQ